MTNPTTMTNNDPTAWILFAALLGACIGFFGCAIFASSKMRRANFEGYKEGLAAGERSARKARL
jgi:hypothetical protein